MRPYNRLISLGVLLFLASLLTVNCDAVVKPKSNTIVLSSGEFGPQVLSYKFIGFDWFQWNTQGPDDPKEFDDVKVVVYRNISLDEVKKMYPVDEKKLTDYRYVEYQAAMDYLKQSKDEAIPVVKKVLDETKTKIIENLGSESYLNEKESH